MVSSEAANPSLSHGWAIFSEVTKYYAHLAKYRAQPEEVSNLNFLYAQWTALINIYLSAPRVSNITQSRTLIPSAQRILPPPASAPLIVLSTISSSPAQSVT